MKKNWLTFFLIIHIFLIGPLVPRAWGKKQKTKEDLKNLEKQIKVTKQKIEEKNKDELSILSRLNDMDKKLDKIKKEINIYEFNLRQNQKKVQNAKAQIQKIEKDMKRGFSRLKGRLRAIYKSGGIGGLRVLFSTRSISEILQSLTMMRYIAQYDVRLLDKLKHERESCLKERIKLDEYKKRVELYKTQAMDRRSDLIKQQSERKKLLASIREDKGRQISLLKGLEESSEKLKKLLAKETWYAGTGDFGKLKGLLMWPVKGKVSAPFGFYYDSVLNRKIVNNGIRIKARLGADVLSIASGKVIYADWFCGYGKMVIIDHGQGYNSIYAHSSELFVREGQAVEKGQKVAAVGDTDSIRGPELYFEIRYKGRPINPVSWLEK